MRLSLRIITQRINLLNLGVSNPIAGFWPFMKQYTGDTVNALVSELALLPDAIWRVDAEELHVQNLNWQDKTLFGYAREQILGRPLRTLIPGVSPALFEKALQGKHDPHADTPLRLLLCTADGNELPVDLKVAKDGTQTDWIVVMRWVSESARIAEREFVTVVAAAPDAIISWFPDGRIVSWNPAAARLYGLSAEDAIGRSIEEFVPDESLDAFRNSIATLLKDGKQQRREVFRLRRGLEIEVEETLFIMRDLSERPIRVGCFARDLFEISRLRRIAETLSRQGHPQAGKIGYSNVAAMQQTYRAIDAAAAAPDTAVLLLGETGVGKTVLARRIHSLSPRQKGPFLAVNCSALEANLAESELFGHERGAFTGAMTQKRGLVEAAHGGTLFLDEIGELPLAVQAKLLTFLDTHAYRRLGAIRDLHADVRILAATNAHLTRAVEQGLFRQDLYYRLGVLPIRIPPLRERVADLPDIIQTMLENHPKRGHRVPRVSPAALFAMQSYTWPGNLRELRNALERSLLLSGNELIDVANLPEEIQYASSKPVPRPPNPYETPSPIDPPPDTIPSASPEALAQIADQHILEILSAMGGHRGKTAQKLGISRSTLTRKLNRLGVSAARKKVLRPSE